MRPRTKTPVPNCRTFSGSPNTEASGRCNSLEGWMAVMFFWDNRIQSSFIIFRSRYHVDHYFHRLVRMFFDEFIGIVILRKREMVGNERLGPDGAICDHFDRFDIVFMAVHHAAQDVEFVFAEEAHVYHGVLYIDADDDHGAAVLYAGDHLGECGLGAYGFEADLETLVAECAFYCVREWFFCRICGGGDAALAGNVEFFIFEIGDEDLLGAAGQRELGHEVADGAGAGDDDIFSFQIAWSFGGVCAHGDGFDHGHLVIAHGIGDHYGAVFGNDEIFLCAAFRSGAAFDPEVLTDVVVTAPAGGALAAYDMWTGGSFHAGGEIPYAAADLYHFTAIFMALDHGIRISEGVFAIIHMYIRPADAYAMYLQEDLVLF